MSLNTKDFDFVSTVQELNCAQLSRCVGLCIILKWLLQFRVYVSTKLFTPDIVVTLLRLPKSSCTFHNILNDVRESKEVKTGIIHLPKNSLTKE